jgi:dipeptidyl-peptidase-4
MRAPLLPTLAVALCALPLPLAAQQPTRFASLQDALRSGAALAGGGGPRDVNWIDGGRRYSFTARNDSGGEEIRVFDPATLKDSLLFRAGGLTFPGASEPFEYQSFQWAHDSKHLVFQTHFKQLYRRSGTSDYFVYTLADRSLTIGARAARTAELSPDGSAMGYERDGNMFVYDLTAKHETQLTSDATPTSYNGHFDWVYEEEFGLAQAWNWSPDSRYIAYWHLDEGAEPAVQFSDFAGHHPEWTSIRIPQPGDSNPTVRIGVIDAHSGHSVWLDPGEAGEFYIPRVYWTSRPDTLAVVTLNRPQNTVKLYFFDVKTGGKRLVFTQTSDTWIDVFDFYANVQDLMSFPAGRAEFLWISDRDGWQHIYRYDYSGKLLGQVTRGRWSVSRIEGTDSPRGIIYYTSTEASPLERQLYAIGFDGKGARRLTTSAGTHNIDMSPDTRYYIDHWSAVSQPRQVELWATADRTSAGRLLKKLEDNAKVTQWLGTHAYSAPTLMRFTTSDSAQIDISVVKPVPFDSTRRYPMVFAIYGGPGSQQVYNSFSASAWTQWLAQQGYLVVGVNNRGTNNYGSAFMKTVYKRLGYWEAHDFAEAAKFLGTKSYADAAHVAIIGTSYGGYSTVYTMEMYPDIFTVGMANSPVTDWRLYDSIYTERYMGLLGDNAAGYDSSSGVKHAGQLKGHLLLIHSMMDDNVHPQNTMQLLTALADARLDVDLRIYPPGHHGAAYNQQSFFLIQQATSDHLARYLKPGSTGGAVGTH